MNDPILATIAQRWRLWRAPRTKVRDLADGAIVKVVGRARVLGEPVLAPFTGRSLVALRAMGVRIEQRARSVVQHVLDDIEKGQSFFLEDETGIVRIDRAGFSRLFVRTFGASESAAGNVERYFAHYGQHERTLFDGFGPSLYYYERGVEVDAEVAVWGKARATEEAAPAGNRAGYRDASRLFVIEPPANEQLLVSEEPRHRR